MELLEAVLRVEVAHSAEVDPLVAVSAAEVMLVEAVEAVEDAEDAAAVEVAQLSGHTAKHVDLFHVQGLLADKEIMLVMSEQLTKETMTTIMITMTHYRPLMAKTLATA